MQTENPPPQETSTIKNSSSLFSSFSGGIVILDGISTGEIELRPDNWPTPQPKREPSVDTAIECEPIVVAPAATLEIRTVDSMNDSTSSKRSLKNIIFSKVTTFLKVPEVLP